MFAHRPWLVGRSEASRLSKRAGQRLYQTAVIQSRRPALYAEMGAPDSVEGRFELLTLHVILLIDRLAGDTDAAATRQALFDVFLSDLDGALREMGVGDLAVGKRMKKLGQIFYGRARAYDAAFSDLPDVSRLEALCARTILAGLDGADPEGLAAYAARQRGQLAALETAGLLSGELTWPLA